MQWKTHCLLNALETILKKTNISVTLNIAFLAKHGDIYIYQREKQSKYDKDRKEEILIVCFNGKKNGRKRKKKKGREDRKRKKKRK